jgi:hypothetical protein
MVLGAQKFPPRWNFTVYKKKASVGGSLLWSFGWSYADALAEAGSGKTCAVDVQAADACHVVLASFVWGGQKNRDGDFMDGAVVVVLNADGKAFLAHNMVLCEDDQWICELVGFPAQSLSNDTLTFVLDVCATLALVKDLHLAASQCFLGQDRQVDLLLPPQDHRIAVLSARVHALWN